MAFGFDKIKKGLKKAWSGEESTGSIDKEKVEQNLGAPFRAEPKSEPTVVPSAKKPAAYDEYKSEFTELFKKKKQ